MRAHGAAGPSFATIVAAGPHSAVPHHSPTATPLRRGDFVKLDFGALVDGYHSDMTRTVVLGAAADWQRELYALVAAAQAAGRAALMPGRRRGRRRRGRAPGRRRRGARRAVRAPARARRGAADPRGPAAGRHRIGHASPRAWPSPWSPASTSRVAAACGSRTRSSSPTARPRCSPGSPRICWRSDRAILERGRRRAPQISARAAHPGACSPRATDERRSRTPWPPRTTSRTDWC